MSVESHNASTNEKDSKKSGFITCIWVLGFGMSCCAGFLHASKLVYMFVHLSFSSPESRDKNLLITCMIFFIVVTPFADIVLLSFNSATAIVINVLLAIIVLNEVFICRYDLPALTLIISGSVCIIMTANFSEHVSNVAVHKENLTSIRSVCFYSCVGLIFYLTVCLFKRMRKSLATFERETDLWLQSKEKHISEPRDE